MDRCGSPWGVEEEFQDHPDDQGDKNYQKNLLQRFHLVNQYCDLSVEPVTFNSVNKIWLGGNDALDYVVCYSTKGNPKENIPDHWHYVSFGLSDIHGSTDIVPGSSSQGGSKVSGFGFELTFRLKTTKLEGIPPAWPVDLLQKLARYVHATPECLVVPGDHITWHSPLHGNLDVPCEINHMLVSFDWSLPKLETTTGSVAFHQIVGVTYSEIELAQRWNASALLNLFKEEEELGGKALITDIFREKSILEMHPHLEADITAGIQRDGSDLNGVTGRVLWTHNARFYCHESHWWALSDFERRQYIHFENSHSSSPFTLSQEEEMGKVLSNNEIDQISNLLQGTKLEEEDGQMCRQDLPKHIRDRIICPGKVHLTACPETAKLLPLALKGRVDHKRHFTIKDAIMNDVITFVPKEMPGSFTTDKHNFAACGPWLHIQLEESGRNQICEDLAALFSPEAEPPTFPRFLAWPDARIALTILEIRD